MRPLLITAVGRQVATAPFGRRASDVEVRQLLAFPAPGTIDPARPTVILLDRALLRSLGGDVARLEQAADVAAIVGVGEGEEREPDEEFPTEVLSGFIPGDAAPGLIVTQLRGGFRHAMALVTARAARDDEQQRHRELHDLAQVGVALSTERNLLALLEMILSQARRVSTSDGGSIYLVERDENEQPVALRFKLAQNDSIAGSQFSEFTVPIDHTSLAGHVATTGEPLIIADVYLLPVGAEYKQNRSFDERFHYRTKSMLVIPLRTQRDEIVGVLQLINRKRSADVRLTSGAVVDREVLSYDARSVELVSALASQAAVSIENSLLYEDIEKLFEGFVTAAVTAIESRDPTTFGHSGRVADYSVTMAEMLERHGAGAYRDFRFSREQIRELRYASLLHDFGKVGVREQVLVKAKKLYPPDLAEIRNRFAYLRQSTELEFERRRADHLAAHGAQGYETMLAALVRERDDHLRELDRILNVVLTANEPSILAESANAELRQLKDRTWVDAQGVVRPLLNEGEVRLLTIPQGTLDEGERREIESHVTHTFRFLREIPWTRELRNLPEIAYGHHEKLNGGGYPRGIAGVQIPVQTRIMTIADIYDALTAADRPYKRAVPVERALDILTAEAKSGLVDPDLLGVFVAARVYERAAGNGTGAA